MEHQTSSAIDQNKAHHNKTKKIKPLHFLVGFILVSSVIAFLLGGYFIGKDKSTQKKQNSSTSIEKQTNLDPVGFPGNPDNWIVIKLEPLNIEFKMPDELNKKGEWKITEINGKKGKIICFSDQDIKDENKCSGNILAIGSTSKNFSSDRNFFFTDAQGFTSKNEIYYVNGLNNKYELKNIKLKSSENNNGFKIIKILGDGTQGTPEEGFLGALVNTNNPNYPGMVLQMKIDSDISEYEFDQILESIKEIN